MPESSRSSLVELRGVSKEYMRDKTPVPGAQGHRPRYSAGRLRGGDGAFGIGQVDAVESGGRTRSRDHRHGHRGRRKNWAQLSEAKLTRWRSHHLGFIFQLYNLMPVLTAFENVELPLLLTSLSRRERAEHVRTALRDRRACKSGMITFRGSFPAVRSSAWRSPAPW